MNKTETEAKTGAVEILNVGTGDTKITIDPTNPEALAQAKAMISDMIKRGYSLLIEIGGKWQRIEGFDEEKGEYIIAVSVPMETSKPTEIMMDMTPDGTIEVQTAAGEPSKVDRPKKYRRGRVAMGSTTATAVAPSAGG